MINIERTILHIDANKFYASCEASLRPELRDIPFVVGGDEDARHGIVLAANEQARAFGIKTAETLYSARKKCPGIKCIPARYSIYENYSHTLRKMYEEYTDQVEPFGLDECWLDVTGSVHLFGSGESIAHKIRVRVKDELGITISAGVSWNKIFAKLGSDYKKPDAVTVISKENFQDIVWPLPVSDLMGVGGASAAALKKMGVYTMGQLAIAPDGSLKAQLGVMGEVLKMFANGIDLSRVATTESSHEVKTIGNSRTTPFDLVDDDNIRIVLYQMAESVAARLREGGYVCRSVQISIRGNDMAWYQRQCKMPYPCQDSTALFKAAYGLYCANRSRVPIRNIGVRAGNLIKNGTTQLSLMDDIMALNKHTAAEYAMDEIRAKFGHHAVRRGVMQLNPGLSKLNPKEEHTIYPVSYFLKKK